MTFEMGYKGAIQRIRGRSRAFPMVEKAGSFPPPISTHNLLWTCVAASSRKGATYGPGGQPLREKKFREASPGSSAGPDPGKVSVCSFQTGPGRTSTPARVFACGEYTERGHPAESYSAPKRRLRGKWLERLAGLDLVLSSKTLV